MGTSTSNLVAELDGKTLSTWYIVHYDCSNHISGNTHLFTSFSDVPPSRWLTKYSNRTHSIATKEGIVTLNDTLILPNILYVHPELINYMPLPLVPLHRNSRILIEAGKETIRVYWFQPLRQLQENETTTLSKYELWHRHLKYPFQIVILTPLNYFN